MQARQICFIAFVTLVAGGGVLAEDQSVRTVTVSGSGLVVTPPDEVVLTVEVATQGNELLETRQESDEELRAILELGQQHGVDPKDFRVTELKISYGFDEERRRFFYRVDRSADMTLKDIGKFDALLAAALKRGGFNITGIAFGTSTRQDLMSEARRRAVAEARAKATELAELNGLKLGLARTIDENQFSQTPFVTSVVPAVGVRQLPRRDNSDPFGGPMYSSESPPATQSSARFVSFARPGSAEGSGGSAKASEVAAGLGVIETTASLTIEFELIEKAP